MAGSATITGRQNYVLGIGHPKTEAPTEGAPAVFSADGKSLVGVDGVLIKAGRTRSIILFGDSRTADCNYNVFPNTYSTNMSWFEYGNHLATGGPVFDLLRNAGIGGNTTQQMLDRVDSDVIAYAPSYCTLWGGTNDSWTSAAQVDLSAGRMAQILEKLTKAGIYVYVISETVCSSIKGTAFPGYVARYNEALRALCLSNYSCEYVDINAQVIDPASANGYAKSSMLRDGVHLSPYGASLLGKNVWAPLFSRLQGRVCALVASQVDTQGISADSRNILGNPLMLGSTAASGTGQSGNWPTGWTTSGQTAVCSVSARSDGFGNDFVIALTAAGVGSFNATYIGGASRVVAGKTYVIEAALELSSAVNVSQVSITCDMTVDGVTYRRGSGQAVQAAVAGDSIVDYVKTVRTDTFVAPSGTYTGLSLLLRFVFAGAGSANVKLGRVSLKQID